MFTVVVGDAATIEAGLSELGMRIVKLNEDGSPAE